MYFSLNNLYAQKLFIGYSINITIGTKNTPKYTHIKFYPFSVTSFHDPPLNLVIIRYFLQKTLVSFTIKKISPFNISLFSNSCIFNILNFLFNFERRWIQFFTTSNLHQLYPNTKVRHFDLW